MKNGICRIGILILSCVICFLEAGAQDTTRREGFQQFFYPNGKLSSEGFLKEGKPDGYWKSYQENGNLKSEGNRKNFELDSTWKFYSAEGKLLVEINYRSGKKNGLKISYLDAETVKENYRNDIREGYTRYYFPNGKLKQEIPFVNGLEQGYGKEYGTDGSIITLTEYKRGFIVDRLRINRKDSQGRKQGRWCWFYDSGSLKAEVTFRDDLRHGYYKEYAENGDLLKVQKYEKDVLQEEAAEVVKPEIRNEYYPDGQLKVSALFRNGVAEGIRREYTPDGRVEHAWLYKNGILVGEGIELEDGNREGPWKDYYADGSLKAEGAYAGGKKSGEWKYYYADGKLEQQGKYGKQGKLEGTWKWYFDDGLLAREESYRNGAPDGLSTEYDETGRVIQEGEYVEGKEDGPWFEITGDCLIRGTYRDGMRNGMWKYYYLDPAGAGTDSLCFYKGNFIDDNPDGVHTSYWENGKVKDEGRFVNGRKEGDWYKFNSDGTLFMTITYQQGAEVRFDGVRIKPPFEREEE